MKNCTLVACQPQIFRGNKLYIHCSGNMWSPAKVSQKVTKRTIFQDIGSIISHRHHRAWDLHGIRPTDVSPIFFGPKIHEFSDPTWSNVDGVGSLVWRYTDVLDVEPHLCGKKINETRVLFGHPKGEHHKWAKSHHGHADYFSQVVPIIGQVASEQICTLTHSSRSRFLPCLAGMVMIVTETLPSTLFKVCLNDSGIVMLAREVQPSKA